MIRLRRWTILLHRYLGIAFAALFVLWFLSGIGMLFWGMPEVSDGLLVERLPPLDWTRVHVAPEAIAGDDPVTRVVLTTVMGRPAYRVNGRRVVFADTGEALDTAVAVDPLEIAAEFSGLPRESLRDLGELRDPDQWTLETERLLPARRIVANDDARSEFYVSTSRAAVIQYTTRRTRGLAWVSAIPHWLYFTPLRSRGLLWSRVVIWSSGVASMAAFLGLVLAIVQFSPRRPFQWRRVLTYNPYAGWVRWHYVSGLFFGVFAVTWTFSGLLSMQPGDWASGSLAEADVRLALRGRALNLSQFATPGALASSATVQALVVKEVEYFEVEGVPFFEWRDGSGHGVVSGTSLGVVAQAASSDSMRRAVEIGTSAPVAEFSQLADYDAYYYSKRREAPLPVVRVKLNDPDRSWLYIDPQVAEVVGLYSRRARLERWLYHGLHSLDFTFWYHPNSPRELVIIVLSCGGLFTAVAGAVLGARRVTRRVRRSGGRRNAVG